MRGGVDRLQVSDVRAMLRLSNALHEQADAAERKKALLEGVCRITGAGAALSAVVHFARNTARRTTLAIVHAISPARFDAGLADIDPSSAPHPAEDPDDDLPWNEFVRRAALSLTRDRASPTTDWYTTPRRLNRKSQRVYSFLPFSGTRVVACLALLNPPRRGFGPGDLEAVRVLHSELSWVYKPDLLLAVPGTLELPARQRQTLQYLLAGHSEKQIAIHLGLSHNTVHHYVKALYRHFGVSTRSKLLARWLGKEKPADPP